MVPAAQCTESAGSAQWRVPYSKYANQSECTERPDACSRRMRRNLEFEGHESKETNQAENTYAIMRFYRFLSYRVWRCEYLS